MGRMRFAQALWIAWAVIVWNVVFDRVIVVAGRAYIAAAGAAARTGGPYAPMDDWMGPAVGRAFWMATAAAALILIVGFAAFRKASRQARAGRP
jgi:hypothetical protein